MRITIGLAISMFLAIPALSQTRLEVKDIQNHPFSVDFPSGNKLRLHLRSGEFHVVGRDDNKVSVSLSGSSADRASELTVRFKIFGSDGDLRVSGGPKNNLQVTVGVPKASMLRVRMPAGDLSIEGVSGDKDVELHAGEVTVSVGEATDYGHVDASVTAGDLEAAPFHESHGGLFRSFEKRGSGQYTLHAHVGAGVLTLR